MAIVGALAGAADTPGLPAPADRSIDYQREVRPLLEQSCVRCHGPNRPKGGFRLDDPREALRGGSGGKAIVPGDSAASPLIQYVARLVKDMEMPPVGRGEPLTQEQVGILRAWIDQGAVASAETTNRTQVSYFSATPTVRGAFVTGNKARFRQDTGIVDGVSGGLDELEWIESIDPATTLHLRARGLANQHDYRVELRLVRKELGYLEGGFDQYRKWYSDVGGYSPIIPGSPSRLGFDLSTDYQRAWFEAGLDRSGLPKMSVAYEQLRKEGSSPTLHWGSVLEPTAGVARAILPSWRMDDQTTHLVRFDLAHEYEGLRIEDSFQAEWYQLAVRREEVGLQTLGSSVPDALTRSQESYDHFQAANSFRVEKALREWWFVSGGYSYASLEGNAGYSMETLFPSDPTLAPFQGDYLNELVLSRSSHVLNANTRLGPWRDLSLIAGFQSDWTRQQGFGRATIQGFSSPMSADLDRWATSESAELQYKGIPYTVLHAGGRFQQENYGQNGQTMIDDGFDGSQDFLRETDAHAGLSEALAGFTASPWQAVTFGFDYRHSLHDTDYDHLRDEDLSPVPGNGYPAFITARDIDQDSLEARVAVRVLRWWRAAAKYQLVATDYRTTTREVVDDSTVLAGGGLLAGNYDSHIWTLENTWTPWGRLHLSATLSYGNSRTVSGIESVESYQGDTYAVLTSATLALDPKTDLTAAYAFSAADFGDSAVVETVPMGLEYERHGLLLGLGRKLPKGFSARLQYGFFEYSEPSVGSANDYTAHVVFASFCKKLP